MNGIKIFVTSFCVSSIVMGLLFLLVPNGALKKPVKYIFCMCFVCCLIGSVTVLSKPDFSDFKAAKNQAIISESSSKATAEAVFCEALRSQNINFRKITVDVNKSDSDSITINKVTVYTTDEAEKILNIIGSDSYEVVIINE